MLLKFRTDKGRDPSCDTFGEDSELLLQIRNDVLDSLGVNPDLLPEDFVRLVSAFIGLAWIDKHLRVCLTLGRCFPETKSLEGSLLGHVLPTSQAAASAGVATACEREVQVLFVQ